MRTSTKNSIKNMYNVFEKYELNPNMEASPMYAATEVAKWNQQVSIKPMQELDGDTLSFIAFKVGYTWGTITDYKHFLPRFFELIAQYKEGLIDISIVFKKLEYFKWETWTQSEYQSVLEFINALWLQVLNDVNHPYQFEEIFSSIAKIHPSFDWILNQWLLAETESSIYQFCDFMDQNTLGGGRIEELESFKEYKRSYTYISSIFLRWATSDMKVKLEKSYEEIKNETLALQVLDTLEFIEKIAAQNKNK